MSAAPLGTAWALDWARRAAATVAEHRSELDELDRAIGDGDHGENLARGFEAGHVAASAASAAAASSSADERAPGSR